MTVRVRNAVEKAENEENWLLTDMAGFALAKAIHAGIFTKEAVTEGFPKITRVVESCLKDLTQDERPGNRAVLVSLTAWMDRPDVVGDVVTAILKDAAL